MNNLLITQASERYADSIAQHDFRKQYCKEDFIAGAKWALEQSLWENTDFLPDDGEHVFIRDHKGMVKPAIFVMTEPPIFMSDNVRYKRNDVSAWMPIPKYEAEE